MSPLPPGAPPPEAYTQLASYRQCRARADAGWAGFQARRRARLAQQRRYGQAAEKVAEEVLTDFLTSVLDWPLESLNYQLERADVVLTTLGIKRLVIEAKRPGALPWSRTAVDRALEQARRYAAEQKITRVAVSDGDLLYAEDWEDCNPRPRLLVCLDAAEPSQDLWWLSQDGIYRSRLADPVISWPVTSAAPLVPPPAAGAAPELLHTKYQLPARCFAFVPKPNCPNSWKLPYLLGDGRVDAKRLPKAIQCLLTNYRGTRADIPEAAVPGVLSLLEAAARACGQMPDQRPGAADAYRQLEQALAQLRRGDRSPQPL
ncbi:MAG: hypothetical protein ACRD2E_05050 [Terriglobales bacterium]